MVDLDKRTTLRVITGAAAIAATPSMAAAGLSGGAHDEQHSNEEFVVPVNASTELTIALSVDPEPVLRLTNNSKQLLIVRHVYPGLIHAGTETYDINSVFVNCAYAISAGRSRTIKIQPTKSTQAEVAYPRQLYRNQPQRAVTVTGNNHMGTIVNSTRSFYA